MLALAVLFLIASWFETPLYGNYLASPALFAVILAAVAGLLGIRVFLARKAFFRAWFASALVIISSTFFGVIGLYPAMFPSRLDPAWSLTAHNSASSPMTLRIMLIVVLIFIPIVLAYQVWAYNLFKGKVGEEDIAY
jgi:cytochrome d ubiquinol oxidase subunit II